MTPDEKIAALEERVADLEAERDGWKRTAEAAISREQAKWLALKEALKLKAR